MDTHLFRFFTKQNKRRTVNDLTFRALESPTTPTTPTTTPSTPTYADTNAKALTTYQEFGMRDFRSVIKVENTGDKSANGSAFRIDYARLDDKTKTTIVSGILKCTQTAESDNLVYEYSVGRYLNEFCDFFPCFIHTYGLFKYQNEERKEEFVKTSQEQKLVGPNTINSFFATKNQCLIEKNIGDLAKSHCAINSIEDVDFNFRNVMDLCNPSETKLFCYLSENIENASSFKDWKAGMVKEMFSTKEVQEDVTRGPIEYQYNLCVALLHVYSALYSLYPNFTHYDLHDQNVLMVAPLGKGSYTKFVYHYVEKTTKKKENEEEEEGDEKELTVYSEYVPKIIDFGRSYCATTEDFWRYANSKKCGYDQGFGFFEEDCEKPIGKGGRGFICPDRPNASCDLRLLSIAQTDIIYEQYKENKKTIQINGKLNLFPHTLDSAWTPRKKEVVFAVKEEPMQLRDDSSTISGFAKKVKEFLKLQIKGFLEKEKKPPSHIEKRLHEYIQNLEREEEQRKEEIEETYFSEETNKKRTIKNIEDAYFALINLLSAYGDTNTEKKKTIDKMVDQKIKRTVHLYQSTYRLKNVANFETYQKMKIIEH